MVKSSVAWKRFAKTILLKIGWDIRRIPRRSLSGLPAELIQPGADYAPWQQDGEFLRVYETIRASTLVDLYRCWELWTLLPQLRQVPGIILEIGVWRGGTAALLGYRARTLGIDAPIYLCDTFHGVVKASEHDRLYQGGEHADCTPEMVQRLLSRLAVDEAHILKGVFPEETAHHVPDGAIRLCHIDVDTHDSAAGCFEWAWPRLSPGGVVVFDDYGFTVCSGVSQFVDGLRGAPGRLVVHNLNGHAVVVKTAHR